MPRRPPKKWFYKTLRAMAKNLAVTDPERLTAWQWYHQLTPEKKREILSKEEENKILGSISLSGKRSGTMARKKFKKGSKAAKDFMRKLRSMKKTSSRRSKPRKRRSKSGVLDRLNVLRRKGREMARRAKIKPFFFTGRRRPQITISEGDFLMEGRAKKRRHGRKSRSYGFDGRKRRRHGRRSRRGLFMGARAGVNIPRLFTQGAIGAAGAVGSAYIAKVIPLPANMSKFKPAIPLIVSVLLLTIGKRIPMSQTLAFGSAVSGVLGFAKQVMPQLPTLAGVDTAPELTEQDRILLGAPQNYGAVQEFQGQESAVTPADL